MVPLSLAFRLRLKFGGMARRLGARSRLALLRARPKGGRYAIDRVLGRPGVVLVSEGPSSRAATLLANERKRTARFVDGLRLFRIGFSWGGVTSLVMAYPGMSRLDASRRARLVRLNVGLEEPADLIADLQQALEGA